MAELRSYNPTWSDKIRVGTQEMLRGLGVGKFGAQDTGNFVQFLLENAPVTGNLLAANKLGRDDQGPLDNLINTVVAAMPAGGGLAAKVAKPAVAGVENLIAGLGKHQLQAAAPLPKAAPLAAEPSLDEMIKMLNEALGKPGVMPKKAGPIETLGKDVYNKELNPFIPPQAATVNKPIPKLDSLGPQITDYHITPQQTLQDDAVKWLTEGLMPTPKGTPKPVASTDTSLMQIPFYNDPVIDNHINWAKEVFKNDPVGLQKELDWAVMANKAYNKPGAATAAGKESLEQVPYLDHGIEGISAKDQMYLDKLHADTKKGGSGIDGFNNYDEAHDHFSLKYLHDGADDMMKDAGAPLHIQQYQDELNNLQEAFAGKKITLAEYMDQAVPLQQKINAHFAAPEPKAVNNNPYDTVVANLNVPANPVDEATRQANRIQGNYILPVYHGAQTPFESTVVQGSQMFGSTSPELANMYAGVKPHYTAQGYENAGSHNPQHVVPMYANPDLYHVFDAKGKDWTQVNQKAVGEARAKDKQGVIINNVWDEPSTSGVPKPGDIGGELMEPKTVVITLPMKSGQQFPLRSAHAQFDPKKFHLNDLLAGLAGLGFVGAATKKDESQ